MTPSIPFAGRIGLWLFLGSAMLFFAAPIWVMVMTSLKTMPEIRDGSILALPVAPTLQAWRDAWGTACLGLECSGISAGFWNSVVILVPSVVLSVGAGALNGYALSLWRVRGADAMLFLLIAAGFIPYQVIVFPLVKIMAAAGLFGTLPGIVLIHVVFSLPILTLIFRNHFLNLPVEVIKAARVDGAGYWAIFWHVVLPLSPGIVMVAVIIQVTGIWNDFLLGLIFAGLEWQPMTVQLNNLTGSTLGARRYDLEMAATLLTAIPPLLVYLISGRFFVRGITAGAIKG